MSQKYDHKEIEAKWQKVWEESGLYKTEDDSPKPKTYVLDMFPYPSGEGLHVGHPKGYIATDIYSRHMRMCGRNVLHPMGWDAFGLPAENYALKNKIHPALAVEKNIAYFKEQLAGIGFDYDWSREINTTDPKYYKWTQWIFLKLFEKGLAFQSHEPINWCPSCMTGLANEDLDGNACERCDTVVEKKSLPQWVLKITAYADRMLADLDQLQWPEHIKEAQRNWIGRSEGSEIEFAIAGSTEKVRVFTTRADTLFGATYLVLAPEHPLLRQGSERRALWEKIENKKEVSDYINQASAKTEIERSTEGRDKTGVELKGIKAMNPANKEEIPVYVADYVLGGYGTSAIMAVPAHDERDYAFAQKFNLPTKQVVEPLGIQTVGTATFREDEPAVEHHGIIAIVKHWSEDKYIGLRWPAVGWGTWLTGTIESLSPEETTLKEIREESGYKNPVIKKSLGVIHSKYYHAPKKANRIGHTPVFYVELADGERDPVSAEETAKHELAWLTKEELRTFLTGKSHQIALDMFISGVYTGRGLLANSGEFNGTDSEEAKAKVTAQVGGKVKTNYKLRDWVFSRQRYWGEPIPIIHCPEHGAVAVPYEQLPVLLPEVESYEPSGTGESPLATITDWVNTTCPTCGGPAKRETNTMPQWAGSSWYYLRFMDPDNAEALVGADKEKYWAPVDVYVGGDHAVRHLIYARFWHKFLYDIGSVSTIEPFARLEFLGFILAEDGRKMSKRYGNVINPNDVVAEHGADAFRIYEMFMGPFENTISWNTKNLVGSRRFVERVWRLQEMVQGTEVPALDTELARTIKKVGEDIEAFKFNTAVSQMMIFLNAVEKEKAIGKGQWQTFLKVLAPFAPHVAEELWAAAGNTSSVHLADWPQVDASKLVASTGTIAVQVNGKVRGTVELAADVSEVDALTAGRAVVARWLDGNVEKKALYVAGRVINFVI